MKNIFKTLAVLALVAFASTADAQRGARQERAFVQLEGEGGPAVVSPVDNKGNAKIDNVKPGNHQAALLVPAVQKVREAAARANANGTPAPSIEIESFSWGVSQMGTGGHGGGGGAGKVNVHDISVTKVADKASPNILQAVVVSPIKAPLVNIVKHDGKDYYKIELENILVSSYQSGGSSAGDRPMESLSLNFTKIEFKYDLKENKK